MQYPEVLCLMFPNALWEMEDVNDYETLIWNESNSDPKPSKKTLDELLITLPIVVEREAVEETRRQAYQRDADPLYFGFQRGDNTEQEWLDAVAKVKADNPYPEVTN